MGVKERYEERQKKGKTSEYSGVKQRYMAKGLDDVASNITNRVNTWLNNHNTYISNYQKRNSGRKYDYSDSYVSDSSDWLTTASQQKSNFDAEAESILSYMDQYKDYLDSKWVNNVRKTITEARGTQNQIVDHYTKDNEYWKKFTPNEDQTAAGYTADKLYTEWQAEQKQYAEDMAYDVEAAMLELEGLKKEKEAYLVDQEEKRKQAQEDESFWDSLGRWLGTTPDTTIPLAGASSTSSSNSGSSEYDNRIAELEGRIERAKYVQGYEGYMDNMDAEDYAANSNYVSTRTDVSKDDARWGLYNNLYDESKLFGDFLYDYINGNQDALDVAMVNDTASDAYLLGFDKGFLKTMTKDEVGVYNYLYKTQGKESANEYLSHIESDLQGRKRAQEQAFWASYAKSDPVGSSVFSTLISPLKGLSYLGQAADMLDDGAMDQNAGYNRFSYIPSTIRSQVSTTIENSGKWGKVGSFAYNTGMSMADFLFTTAVSGGNQGLSLAIMGTGAAADATIAAKDRGLDDSQAFTLGTIAGLAEVAMEKISLGAWLEGDMTEGALRYVLKNALSEGAEEAGTSVVNLLADVIIAGDKSEWNMAMQAYIDQGKTPEEAFGLVAAEQAAQIGLDALGGMLSGAAIGGGTYAGTSIGAGIKYGDTAKNKEQAQNLVAEGLELNPDSKYIQNAKTKLDNGKNLTGMQVRNILAANQEQITSNDMKQIQKAAEKRLTDLGQTESVSELAEIATKWATGQEITRAEKKLLTNSQYGSRVANEMLPSNIESGDYSTEWAEDIGTKQVNAKAYNKKKIDQVRSILDQMAKGEDPATYKSLEDRVGTESKLSVSESGQAEIKGETVSLKKAEVKEFVKDKTGKITDMVIEVDGKTVKASEIDYADGDQSYLFSAVQKIENITPADATVIVRDYDPSSGLTVGQYLNGIDEAYTYGYHGYSEADMKSGDFTTKLSDVQAQSAYVLGQNAKKSSNTNKSESIMRMRTAVEAEAQKAAAEGKEAPKAKKLTITYNKGGGVIVDFDKAALKKLSPEQKAAPVLAEALHEMGLGTNVELYSSYLSKTKVDKKTGKPLRVMLDENGVEVAAPAGIYRKSDGTVCIDLNAYNGRELTLYSMSHELTHFIQQWSDEKYQVLADFLVKTYEKTDLSMHERVVREQARLKGIRGKEVSYNEAFDEVVANAMMKMLADSSVMEKLTELKAQDADLAHKLWNGLKKILSKFFKTYENYPALFDDTSDLMELKEEFEQMKQMWAEAFVEASENFQEAQTIGFEMDMETESVSPAVMRSEQTWNESDYVQQRDKAAQEIAKAIGVSVKKAKDYIDSVNSIAKMIAEDRSRLDYFSSPGRSSFVDNAEYGGSFDFSTLCKKRRLLTGTFTAIQKALPNTALTADEILDIRNRMKKANLEVSCGLCYVEGSRANMGQFAKEFLRLYKQYYPDAWQPNMADVNTPDGIEWVRINHPECYEQYEYFWNHYGTLKDGDKNLFASQQKPKLYQLHTEYKGEILNKFKNDDKVEDKNLNGGIRLQSFSDFEIVHLIDTMQIIMDMSRVGLAGQAYTKVPDFAWALGDTGLKINLSLIAKGVDANGKLIFDDVEGMPIADAMKLRDRYSKNVGTILVAFNDEQLLAAMADDRVDFIIPFHRSQWKKSQYEAMGLPAKTKDYTFMQNEKFIKPQFHEYRGRMVKDKATNYMPNEYWDFSKSGKENAEAYLEMCARNNKRPKFYKLLQNNGDGSYSLKADGSTDGYWKLLIDFKMYDNEGNGSPQMAVKPDFNMEEANRMLNDYSGGHSNFPVAQGIVDDFVKDYKDSHKGEQYSSQQTDLDKVGFVDRSAVGGYDFTKSFLEQLKDYENGVFPKEDTFLLGKTPDVLKKIGLVSLPLTMTQTHIDYALNRSYKGNEERIKDHTLSKEDLAKIPSLIADPVAIIQDRQLWQKKATEYSVDVLVEMEINGKKTLIPINVNSKGQINGVEIDSNRVQTIHGNEDTVQRLINALNEDSESNIAVFYINKEKAAEFLRPAGNPISSAAQKLDGFIHKVTDKGSHVKMRISSVTESQQFIRWFGNWKKNPEKASKVVNADGTPKVMYHGTSTENGEFYVFDYSKAVKKGGLGLRALGKGNYFTSKKLDGTERYGSRVIAAYLDIKKPFVYESGSDLWSQVSKELGVNTDGMNGDELQQLMRDNGYDGVISYNESGDIALAVTFDSNQIKSATDNIGTFDKANPDIRYSSQETDADYIRYDRKAILKESKVDEYLADYAAWSSPKYAQAYIAYMRPRTFLKLTTDDMLERFHIADQAGELDAERLSASRPGIYLRIDHETGKVTGHEGRHRMAAMDSAGIELVPVLLLDNSNKMSKTDIEQIYLHGQFDETAMGIVNDIIPLNYENRDRVIKNFATQSSTQRIGERYGYNKTLRFSTQETDLDSNRALLANAFEGITKSSDEYKLIQEYKGRIKILNEYEEKLDKLNAEIRKMLFDKDTPRDAKKLKELQDEKKKVTEHINRNDKKLLALEASEPLRKVIDRERKKESQKTKDHIKEIQQNKKDRAEQTEYRHKIRKVIRDLDKILNRGNKKQNVKEDMKGFVSKALELADYLFTDHISNDELIRRGITVRMTAKEAALVKETEDILTKLYDEADSLTDEEFARLDAKRKANEDKLKELLTSQRNERLDVPVYNLFNDVVTEYSKLQNSNQDAVKAAYNVDLENTLRSLMGDADQVESLKNMRVADMTTKELENLLKAYKMVLVNVRDADKIFAKASSATIGQMADRISNDFGSRKIPEKEFAIAVQKIANKIGWDYEKLYYALDRIGSEAFTELFMNLADAENTIMQDIIEAELFRDEMIEKYGYNNWAVNKELDNEFLDNTGKKFKLTLGQVMALYAYSRREGAWKHLEFGGFAFGKAALTNPRPADTYKLNQAQCEAITSLLTAEQKAYAVKMQKYLSETMGAKGNEVSMKLHGIELFGEENYFPIHVAGQYMARAEESNAKASQGFQSMSNAGFTHAQNRNAMAPIVLEDFNEIWVDHVNEMSRYHGAVPALEDIRRVMNRSTYSDSTSDSTAIKAQMINAFGEEAAKYFDNLYREANSGAITEKLEKWPKKLLSLQRKLSVAYKLSVLIQQPTSIIRAYAMVDRKYFGFKGFGAITSGVAKAVSSKWNPAYANAYNEMLKYAPGVTMAKEIGGFDTATGGSIRRTLLDTGKSFGQKVKTDKHGKVIGAVKAGLEFVDDNAVANLPNVADKIAWIEIWNACKRETVATHKDLTPNSDEFMQAVGERFTEVIRATQVYDSIFAKSPMLKNKHLAVQYLVSFMNEPNTIANMVEKAMRDITKGNKSDVLNGLKTAHVVIHSIIFTNLLKSIIYAMHDDDEDETYIEKYIEAVVGNVIIDFIPLSYIPLARDVLSLAQGYDVERPDMSIIADAIDAYQKKVNLDNADVENMTEEQLIELDKKQTEAGWKLAESIVAFFGIPLKNVRKDVMGVLNTIRIASANAGMTTAQSAFDKVIDAIPFMSDKQTKYDKLYKAIASGDTDYLDRLKGTYKTEDAYNTAVRKALRENDSRIHDAAQARYDGNIEEYKRIFREIRDEGKFTWDEIMDAVNSEENAIKNKLEPDKATSSYAASDFVEAVSMGDTGTAAAAKDDIIATHVANGKTQAEAEKAFASAVATSTHDAYSSGLLDEAGAKNMLIEYADMDEEEAASRVNYWAFCDEHPEYKNSFTESNVNDYMEFAEPANISLDVYAQFITGTKGLETKYDEWGDVEVSKRDQVLEVIDSLPLTWQQKDALYLAAGYSENKIWDVPW